MTLNLVLQLLNHAIVFILLRLKLVCIDLDLESSVFIGVVFSMRSRGKRSTEQSR